MIEIIKGKNLRSDILIADFDESGYAKNWHFKIGSFFQDALDMKYTPRKIGKITVLKQTQGKVFNFQKGDTIYDSIVGNGEPWHESLKKIRRALVVTDAKPCTLTKQSREQTAETTGAISKKQTHLVYDHGTVWFTVYTPAPDLSKLLELEKRECSQVEFVEILKNGLEHIKKEDLQTELSLF